MTDSLVILVGLIVLSGSAAVWAGLAGQSSRLSPLQKGFAAVFIGVMAGGWGALTLAETGQFSLIGWAAGLSMLTAVSLVFGWRRGARKRSFDWRPMGITTLVILLLGIIGYLIGPPFEYVIGGRDHGVYVNTGIHIARSGQILVEEPAFGDLPPGARAVLVDPRTNPNRAGLPGPWSEGQRLPGFTIRSSADGVYAPHAFHLYPAYFALAYAAAGLETALFVVPTLALLGLWAVFMTADLLFNRWIALGAVALMVVHVTTPWFARYPTAEQLVTLLFWGGSWFFLLWLRDRRTLYAVAAGAAFGLMHLAKLDTVFVPPFLLLFCWVDRQFFNNERHWRPFWVVYLLLTAQAVWHAWQISTIYTIDHLVRTLLPGFLAEPLKTAASGITEPGQILRRLIQQDGLLMMGVAMAAVAGFWIVNWPPFLPSLDKWAGKPWLRRVGLLSLGTIVTALTISQLSSNGAQSAPAVMMSYVGGPVVVLALLGAGSRLRRSQTPAEWFFWGMIAIHIVPFLILGLGTAPDHFWAIRRLIVVFFPAVFLTAMMGLNLFKLRSRRWAGAQPFFLIGVVVLFAIPYLRQTLPFLRVIEFEGLITQLRQIDGQLPDGSILLFPTSAEGIEIGTPLWLAFDHPAYTIDSEEVAESALRDALDQWLDAGRSVYWVASPEIGPRPPETILNYEFSAGWFSPQVIPTLYEQPDTVGERVFLFDFYRVSRSAAEAQSVYTIPLYSGDSPQVISGLADSETRPGALPLRWTTGELVLSLPFPNPASKLVVVMGNPRPAGAPAPVTQIWVGDQQVGEVVPPPRPQAFVFDLSNLDLNGSAEWPVEVIIRTEPWRPADAGDFSDARELGIYVPWVKYVTRP